MKFGTECYMLRALVKCWGWLCVATADLSILLNKLNEGFIALAAQLQVTHEAVKVFAPSFVVCHYDHMYRMWQKNFSNCLEFQSKILPTYVDILATHHSLNQHVSNVQRFEVISILQWCHLVIFAWSKTSKQACSKIIVQAKTLQLM